MCSRLAADIGGRERRVCAPSGFMAEPDELQLSPQQLEFLSGDEELTILPNYSMDALHLITVRFHRLLTKPSLCV
jgi:hypothetical protein